LFHPYQQVCYQKELCLNSFSFYLLYEIKLQHLIEQNEKRL
jgi:hypothetical protein